MTDTVYWRLVRNGDNLTLTPFYDEDRVIQITRDGEGLAEKVFDQCQKMSDADLLMSEKWVIDFQTDDNQLFGEIIGHTAVTDYDLRFKQKAPQLVEGWTEQENFSEAASKSNNLSDFDGDNCWTPELSEINIEPEFISGDRCTVNCGGCGNEYSKCTCSVVETKVDDYQI